MKDKVYFPITINSNTAKICKHILPSKTSPTEDQQQKV